MMQVDPESLKVVTEQELVDLGLEPHIARVRIEHLHEKRQQRIEMLENTIRSGMLGQLTHVLAAVNSKPKMPMFDLTTLFCVTFR